MTGAERHRDPNPSEEPDQNERYRLDPARFPQRVELDLSEELVRQLETLAARTGRSLNDLITELLSRQIDPSSRGPSL